MKKPIALTVIAARLVVAGSILVAQAGYAAETAQVTPAFSPDGGAEALVLGTIRDARRSIRVMAYSFTAEPVVKALILAKRRGVDVEVTVDYRNNLEEDRRGRARAALNALTYAGVPVRVVSAYPIQHEKYIVADESCVELGSYNYTSMAALRNSEDAVLVTGSAAFARTYLENWKQVTALGEPYRAQ